MQASKTKFRCAAERGGAAIEVTEWVSGRSGRDRLHRATAVGMSWPDVSVALPHILRVAHDFDDVLSPVSRLVVGRRRGVGACTTSKYGYNHSIG